MRLAVLLGLLAGWACARPATAQAHAPLRGHWTSLDTLTFTAPIGDGEFFVVHTLRTHLGVTDTNWTETSVTRDNLRGAATGLVATQGTAAYDVRGDSVRVFLGPDGAPAVWGFAVRRDTLTLTGEVPGGEPAAQRFVRSEPMGAPRELHGFWVGVSAPDAAGVPAEFGFRFRPDGLYENGWGETEGAYRALGPYLLLQRQGAEPDLAGLDLATWDAFEMAFGGKAPGPDGKPARVLRLSDGQGASVALTRLRD